MSEMTEKVARALWEHEGGKWPIESAAWRADYFARARAAIEAMREPTEAMRDRYNDPDIVGYGPDGSDHDLVWKAGVEAALSPSSVSDEQGDKSE